MRVHSNMQLEFFPDFPLQRDCQITITIISSIKDIQFQGLIPRCKAGMTMTTMALPVVLWYKNLSHKPVDCVCWNISHLNRKSSAPTPVSKAFEEKMRRKWHFCRCFLDVYEKREWERMSQFVNISAYYCYHKSKYITSCMYICNICIYMHL